MADPSGAVTEAELLDLVDEWHNAGPGTRAARVELHEWLGMTWEQYREWVQRPGGDGNGR